MESKELKKVFVTWNGKEDERYYSLGIQIPSKKVVWGVFRRLNSFSEGSWIPRDCKLEEIGFVVVICCFSGFGRYLCVFLL